LNENVAIAKNLIQLLLLTDFINENQLPIAAPYAVSKAAFTTLTAKLAAAYADQGVLFASICSGRVDTAEPGAICE
jgi:NAD(P)-dependent dehydrogenase (short-subunit alcohol dehydrogenase family)